MGVYPSVLPLCRKIQGLSEELMPLIHLSRGTSRSEGLVATTSLTNYFLAVARNLSMSKNLQLCQESYSIARHLWLPEKTIMRSKSKSSTFDLSLHYLLISHLSFCSSSRPCLYFLFFFQPKTFYYCFFFPPKVRSYWFFALFNYFSRSLTHFFFFCIHFLDVLLAILSVNSLEKLSW